MSEELSWNKKINTLLTNEPLIQGIKTGTMLLLSIIIFVISFGLFDDFSLERLFSWKCSLRVFGFFVSLQLITNALSDLGEFYGLLEKEVIDVVDELMKETLLVDRKTAIEWVSNYNKEERENQLNKKRYEEKEKLLNKQSQKHTKYDMIKDQPYGKLRIFKRRKVKKLKKQLDSIKQKIEELATKNFLIKYEYLEVDDFLYKGSDEYISARSKKKKFNETAGKATKRKVSFKNFTHSVLLFGVQGAILVSMQGSEVLLYSFIAIPTMISTALLSYFITFRRTKGSWLQDQKEKLKDLKRMNKETPKKDLGNTTSISEHKEKGE